MHYNWIFLNTGIVLLFKRDKTHDETMISISQFKIYKSLLLSKDTFKGKIHEHINICVH